MGILIPLAEKLLLRDWVLESKSTNLRNGPGYMGYNNVAEHASQGYSTSPQAELEDGTIAPGWCTVCPARQFGTVSIILYLSNK